MEHLIESVRKYPLLWNSDVPEYKNNGLREAAWIKVTEECNLLDGLYMYPPVSVRPVTHYADTIRYLCLSAYLYISLSI